MLVTILKDGVLFRDVLSVFSFTDSGGVEAHLFPSIGALWMLKATAIRMLTYVSDVSSNGGPKNRAMLMDVANKLVNAVE